MQEELDEAEFEADEAIVEENPWLRKAHQGVFTERLVFIFGRAAPVQPVRMLLISRTSTRDDQVHALFEGPLSSVEQRAPHVFEGRLPKSDLDRVAENAFLFRRIDLSGVVFGFPVPTEDALCKVVISLDSPLSGLQRTQIRNEGVLIAREAFGSVIGEAFGRSLAGLAMVEWIGSVEVKRVSIPERKKR